MQWLISYTLFLNDQYKRHVDCTEFIDVEPSLWWSTEMWRDNPDGVKWDGCIVSMIHEVPEQ